MSDNAFPYFKMGSKASLFHSHYSDLPPSPPELSLHWHNFYELELTLAGVGIQRLNGSLYEMRRGEIHLIRPTDIHNYASEVELRNYLIQFQPSHVDAALLERLGALDGDLVAYLSESDLMLCEALCESIERVNAQSDRESLDLRARMFGLFLGVLIGELERMRRHGESELEPSKPPRGRNFLAYIRESYRNPITAESIAAHFGFNTVYFRRIFREELGISPARYLKLLRLEYAREQLVSSDRKVLDIMLDSGYVSNVTFTRDFREKYGCTPSEMRGSK